MAVAQHPLDGCRIRLARAEEHLQALERELGEYAEGNPCVPAFADNPYHLDARTGMTSVRVNIGDVRAVPEQVAALIGDTLHSIRTALDHLAWQLCVAFGEAAPVRRETRARGEPMTAFPIRTRKPSRDRLGRVAPALLHPRTTDDIEAILDSLQPYQRTDPSSHELETLRRLNDADKHHSLHIANAFVGKYRVILTCPNGAITGVSVVQSYVVTVTTEPTPISNGGSMNPLEPGIWLASLDLSEGDLRSLRGHEDVARLDVEMATLVTLAEESSSNAPAPGVLDLLHSLLAFVREEVFGVLGPLFDEESPPRTPHANARN